jgi:hypothetical protein
VSKLKFGAKKTVAQESQLQNKLEVIACGIADEMISGNTMLKGQLSIQDKCNVLKTLSGYLAISNKVEPPEELGGAFNGYRKSVETNRGERAGDTAGTDGRGTGASADNVVPLRHADDADAAGGDDGAGEKEARDKEKGRGRDSHAEDVRSRRYRGF